MYGGFGFAIAAAADAMLTACCLWQRVVSEEYFYRQLLMLLSQLLLLLLLLLLHLFLPKHYTIDFERTASRQLSERTTNRDARWQAMLVVCVELLNCPPKSSI